MAKEQKSTRIQAPRSWPCREKTGASTALGECMRCEAPKGKKCREKKNG